MIIDLQRRIAEVGRLRIGQQIPAGKGTRPTKLDTWRLTSPDQTRIQHAAKLYGGIPNQWEAPSGNQWEVITETNTLAVVVPPSDMSFSQHYELWSAAGCQRRCDGRTETISDAHCLCEPDARECGIHTRLSVMLRDLPGLGLWRLDTQGYYAALELQGAVDIIQLAAGRGQMLPAQLRLEQRLVKRPSQTTKRFAVPVLDIEVSPAQLLSGSAQLDAGTVSIEAPRTINGGSPLTPVPESVPEHPAASIAEQAAEIKARKPRKGAAQPVARTGLQPRTVQESATRHGSSVGAEPSPGAKGVTSACDQDLRNRIGAEHSHKGNEFHGEEQSTSTPMPEATRRKWLNRMFALLGEADCNDRDDQLAIINSITGRAPGELQHRNDMSDIELRVLVNELNTWNKSGELGPAITEILNIHAIQQASIDGEAAI